MRRPDNAPELPSPLTLEYVLMRWSDAVKICHEVQLYRSSRYLWMWGAKCVDVAECRSASDDVRCRSLLNMQTMADAVTAKLDQPVTPTRVLSMTKEYVIRDYGYDVKERGGPSHHDVLTALRSHDV